MPLAMGVKSNQLGDSFRLPTKTNAFEQLDNNSKQPLAASTTSTIPAQSVQNVTSALRVAEQSSKVPQSIPTPQLIDGQNASTSLGVRESRGRTGYASRGSYGGDQERSLSGDRHQKSRRGQEAQVCMKWGGGRERVEAQVGMNWEGGPRGRLRGGKDVVDENVESFARLNMMEPHSSTMMHPPSMTSTGINRQTEHESATMMHPPNTTATGKHSTSHPIDDTQTSEMDVSWGSNSDTRRCDENNENGQNMSAGEIFYNNNNDNEAMVEGQSDDDDDDDDDDDTTSKIICSLRYTNIRYVVSFV